jgi:hypothetical protein
MTAINLWQNRHYFRKRRTRWALLGGVLELVAVVGLEMLERSRRH